MQPDFIERMKRHWVQGLRLAYSDPLVRGWLQVERAICRPENERAKLQVLTLPTGAGKTEAIKVFCSMPEVINHPGVLIVTRFREEADKIAYGINQHTPGNGVTAKAVHGEAPANGTELGFVPILVTTHAAFRLALQERADGGTAGKWERLQTYQLGKRQWLIIDEAFDWTDSYRIDLGSLRSMAGDLSGALQGEAQASVRMLHDLVVTLTDREKHGSKDRVLPGEQFKALSEIGLKEITDRLAEMPADVLTEMVSIERTKIDTESGENLKPIASKDHYLALLKHLQTVVQIGSAWVSRRKGKSCINASRTLLDNLDMPGIVLDATASHDPAYSLHGDKIQVLQRPANIRRYGNVTLNISTGHSVGKDRLAKHGAKEWSAIWGDLQERLEGKDVLVCAHKDVLPSLYGYDLRRGTLSFANWGNIDGKNVWSRCDAIVLFGLPYLDTVTPAQTFIAARGPQGQDWFDGERRYGAHADIRSALNDGFLARSIVQAVNRVRCRNAIDMYGNCDQTDVYLLLPNGRIGEHIRRAIVEQMPGIKVRNWDAKGAKRKARKRPTEERLLSHFQNAAPGIHHKSIVVEAIGTNARSFERITCKLLDREHALTTSLAKHGVRYSATTGRGKEAFFTKH
jgi:hypothetical protein